MEALSLIDVTAEDDFLLDLASPPPHPDPPHAAGPSVVGAGASDLVPAGGSPAAVAAGRVLDPGAASEQVPERTESPKKMKAKSGVNLRKSLAWDSAFFTSEGVLDTEELGIVNSTFRKAQGSRLLPGIAEEMRRSGESTTSTLENESFVLESLETELFDNVRASIQRTLGKPSGVTAASSKTPKATAKAPPVPARKGVDRIPQSKIRPPVSTSNCGVGSKQRLQVTSKEPTAAGVAQPGAAGAKPSSKPPRALPRVATMRAPTNTTATSGTSDKRSSTGAVVNRQPVGKSAHTSTSMQHRAGGVTKSSSTSKSGALSSAATSPLHNVPMGTMPGVKTKSPTLINKSRTAQRVLRSSTRSDISNVNPAKPDISKVNPARASRNKIPTRSHGERASPVISPSSSLDSMSSVVSGVSTASTVGKMSHTSDSFSTRSSPLSPSLRKSNDQLPSTKSRPPTATEGQSSGTASVDNLKASKDTTTQGKGVRPSGLRRPTPKIGYFDQQEPKPLAPAFNEENSPPQTKALPSPLIRVAPIEPSKVAEHEASMRKTGTVVEVDVVKEMVPALHQNIQANGDVSPLIVELSIPKLSSASSTFDQQESKPTAAPREESSPSQTKVSPSLPLGVAQMEVEPSKVTGHEACACQVTATDTAKENILALHHQNIQPSGDVSPLKENILASHQNIHAIVDASPLKENILASHQNIQTIVDASPLKENILVSHQNIQAIVEASPLTLLIQKLSSISIGDASPMTLLTQKLSSVSLGETTDEAS